MKTPIFNSSSNSNDDSTIPEIYYIIQRFLSLGPCLESAEALKREIEQHELLPKRFDHRGRQHRRSFDEYDKCLKNLISSDFLKRICDQTPSLVDLIVPPGITNVKKSLFSCGNQSIFRTKEKVNNSEPSQNQWTNSSMVWLKCGQPQLPSATRKPPRIDQILFGREFSGALSKKMIGSEFLTSRMELQTRIFGHLSSIFCVAFDRSGQYIFTGADDNLIKVWSVREGRLLYTFRGFAGEITDLTVSHENTLLAAASCDKTIRVWCLRTATPIAVLQGHSAMVTSLQFLPYVDGEDRWLLSTGNDCCVCFWKWNVVTNQFNPVPIKYAERLRVGGQMICSSHSPGGRFVATGGTDHYVRVYVMNNGYPERVIETDGHSDRVDSVQWAHRGLRFLTGSRDGVAKIWTFQRKEWKTISLQMTLRFDMGKEPQPISMTDPKTQRLKVTMVTWSMNDALVVTAVSDHTLRVWDSKTGSLVRYLLGHTDEVYVLEPHPVNSKIFLSAGHDGNLFIWNVITGEITKKYYNAIEGFGHGAFFDARFSIDGENLAAVDSHGHLSIFGADTNEILRTALREQFFHTDYRPLLRDANQYVVDEQTQVAPHLMPPPFLVNSDGDPFPPALQRRVPGKENSSDAYLIPVVVRNPDRDSNEIIDVEAVNEPSQPSTSTGSQNRTENGSNDAEGTSNLSATRRTNSSAPYCAWTSRFVVRPLHPSILERTIETRRRIGLEEINWYQSEFSKEPLPVFIEQPKSEEVGGRGRRKAANHAYGTRRNPRPRVRQEPAPAPAQPLPMVADLLEVHDTSADDSNYSDSDVDSSASSANDESVETSDPDYSDVDAHKPRTRTRVLHEDDEETDEKCFQSVDAADEHIANDDDDDDAAPIKKEKCRLTDFSDAQPSTSFASPLRSPSPSATESKPSTSSARPKRDRLMRKELYIPEDLDETRNRNRSRRVSLGTDPTSLADVPEKFLFPDWITCTVVRKSPYFPQVRDEIVYHPVGHMLYVNAVERSNLYSIHRKTLPFNRHEFQDEELALVVDVRFEISPVRLCCLKLAQLHWKTGKKTGLNYTVRYHDVPNVVDFIVLRQYYDQSLKRKWKQGDRFQAVIDDGWWFGNVMKKEPFDPNYPNSHFQCFFVLWDNGEEEKMSPWDLEPFDASKCPTKKNAMVPVSSDELYSLASYKTQSNEWPPHGVDAEIERICAGIEKIMEFSLAEPFVAPVDLNAYPSYCLCVDYPSDLSTIKTRLENKFYRRMDAVEYDIRQIARNASIFNEAKSQIVKQGRSLVDILMKYLENFECDDIGVIYNAEVNRSTNEKTATTDDDGVENSSQTKRPRRRKYISAKFKELPSVDGREWLDECREIVEIFQSSDQSAFSSRRHDDDSENSSLASADDSSSMASKINSIAHKLETDKYKSPEEFNEDMNILLSSMKNLNQDKRRSKAFSTTIKLRGQYQERIRPILQSWNQKMNRKSMNNRVYNTRNKNSPIKIWKNNENHEPSSKIDFASANNMIQAYQRSKFALNSTPSMDGVSPERRRVIVERSDESENDVSTRPSTSMRCRKPLQQQPSTASKRKIIIGSKSSSSLLTAAILPKRTTSRLVNYNENSDNEAMELNDIVEPAAPAKRVVKLKKDNDDEEEDYETENSSDSTKKTQKGRRTGVVKIRGKSTTTKRRDKHDDEDDSDFRLSDEEDGFLSKYSNKRRPKTKKHADDDDEDEENLTDGVGSDKKHPDSDEMDDHKLEIVDDTAPSKAKRSASTRNSTHTETDEDVHSTSTRPKRQATTSGVNAKRKCSSSSRDSGGDVVDESTKSRLRFKKSTDVNKNSSNNRTRFGGKRVVRYIESSDEENNVGDDDGVDEPKIVLSTSSRGRVCKLRKFS